MTRTAPLADPTNPDDPDVKKALAYRCGSCGAKPGDLCTAKCIDGKPLPNRLVHHYRLDKAFKDDKEAT